MNDIVVPIKKPFGYKTAPFAMRMTAIGTEHEYDEKAIGNGPLKLRCAMNKELKNVGLSIVLGGLVRAPR
jgi:hypothetical protein